MALIPGISRRRFLSTAGQLAAVTALGAFGAQAWAAQGARRLTAGTRTIEVQGRAATVFGLTDERGRQGLTLDIADGFDVALANEAGVPTVIHWHGLTPPFGQDGNTLSQEPIPAGGTKNFAFDLPRGGTNWMHSHFGLQEAQLMAAPLILRDGAADRQEVVMLLHDFSFTSPEELMARLVGDNAGRIGSGMAAMQHGMVRGPSQDGTGMAGMDPSGMEGMEGMDSMGMTMTMPMSGMDQDDMPMDLNDISFDAFLVNDRDLSDPEVIRVDRGAPVRLRVINAASSTNFWIDLGAVRGRLVAVDGMPVRPIIGRRFELTMAQRVDIEIDIPDAALALPILAQREGDTARTGLILATQGARIDRISSQADRTAPPVLLDLERKLLAETPLQKRTVDRTLSCDLTGSMEPYVWGINGKTFENRAPLEVKQGERVEIVIRNRTMMSHPMHLHGHHFQVVGIGPARLSGAMRDTVLVPAMESVTIAFDADNPGNWPFHCHNLYHMQAGMMTALRYL